jgi:hypothetical protein
MALPVDPVDALRVGVSTIFVEVHAIQIAMMAGVIPKICAYCKFEQLRTDC